MMSRDDVVAEIGTSLRALVFAQQALLQRFAAEQRMSVTDVRALLAVMESAAATAPLRPGDLSDRLQLTSGAVTAVVDRLESAGHVRRASHPDDRRSVTLEPTPKAIATGHAHFSRLAERVKAVTSQLDEVELETIRRFLDDMLGASSMT